MKAIAFYTRAAVQEARRGGRNKYLPRMFIDRAFGSGDEGGAISSIPKARFHQFQKGEQNDNKRESPGTSLERSRLAPKRWQSLCRRWLLPQRADDSRSRADEGRLRNHLRQSQRQHATNGCQFSRRG